MERRTLFDAFNEVFEEEMQRKKSKEMAFNAADEKFNRDHGFRGYSSYESFHVVRTRKSKRG